MAELHGIDVAGYQSTSKTMYAQYSFVIVKATEGRTYVNPKWRAQIQAASENGQLLGLYHYCRPENNSPQAEAKHFVDTIRDYIGKAVPCLDWEQKALQHSPAWALTWLRYVADKTGSKPLFYVQQSQAKLAKYKPIADAGFPLWLAQYSKKPGPTVWPKLTVWQYTSNPLDKDVFYGDAFDWYDLIKGQSTKPEQAEGRAPIVGVTKKGMEGVQVKGLQTMLKEYGYYTATVDGKFLDKTELAVKAFQRAEGLVVDGIVGKATWSRLAGLE